MTMAEQGFTDLAAFTDGGQTGAPATPASVNIIRGARVSTTRAEEIEVCDGVGEAPTIVLRKQGGVVTGFDIVCQCGRTSTIEFSYKDE
jgi:hypothetical protein